MYLQIRSHKKVVATVAARAARYKLNPVFLDSAGEVDPTTLAREAPLEASIVYRASLLEINR